MSTILNTIAPVAKTIIGGAIDIASDPGFQSGMMVTAGVIGGFMASKFGQKVGESAYTNSHKLFNLEMSKNNRATCKKVFAVGAQIAAITAVGYLGGSLYGKELASGLFLFNAARAEWKSLN